MQNPTAHDDLRAAIPRSERAESAAICRRKIVARTAPSGAGTSARQPAVQSTGSWASVLVRYRFSAGPVWQASTLSLDPFLALAQQIGGGL